MITPFSKGDIIFVRGNTVISKLIRFFDKGKGFTHVAIALDDNHVLDAQYPWGVRIRHFRFSDYEVIRVPIDVDKAKEYLLYRYDFKQLIWYMFRKGKIWNTPDQFICSEFIAYAMNRKDLVNLTPNELYEKLMNVG